MTSAPGPVVDGLQINDWSREILLECRAGGIDAVNATCAVWEGADETRGQVAALRGIVEANADLALIASDTGDIVRARAEGRTAILPGFQNASPFERDADLVDAFHADGVRIAQLTYNRRNEVGGSCYDPVDEGLTAFGAEVIGRMNAVGMLVDLSHVGDRTCREAVEASARPVAITHANPRSFVDVPRNKPDDVIGAVTARGGVIGVCLYPAVAGADPTPERFCAMVADLAERVGVEHVAVGTDCTRGWGDDYLLYLRSARREPEPGEELPRWPEWPAWFRGPADMPALRAGLEAAGFDAASADRVMGGNWLRLLDEVLAPA